MSGYVGLSRRKKQRREAAGSSGAVQALRMENDAAVVGPDAPTANSKIIKLDIATADWSRPTSNLLIHRYILWNSRFLYRMARLERNGPWSLRTVSDNG